MKLVVGLGNPGKKYKETRHNIGFSIVDNYLGEVEWKEKFNSLFCEKKHLREKILFIKPMSFMNLSGQPIKQFIDYYKINIDDILVIQDDIDIEVGKYKTKRNSSSGGHNGINSIIECLNSDKFWRLKIGVSKPNQEDVIDYVLQKFSRKDKKTILELQSEFDLIIENFINDKLSK